MVATRRIELLPMIYAVRKKNFSIGMIVHAGPISPDLVAAAVFMAHMA